MKLTRWEQFAHKCDFINAFEAGVKRTVLSLAALIDAAVARGKTVDCYGASTKGNMLLQAVGLGPDHVRWALERSEEKVGRYTLTGIPIVHESRGRADPGSRP